MIRRAQHSNRKTLSLKDRVFRLECWALERQGFSIGMLGSSDHICRAFSKLGFFEQECKAVLMEYTAVLMEYTAVLMECRALLMEYTAVLMECRALLNKVFF